MWPVYDRMVYNGSYLEPYTNPGAPVHITSGSAVSRQNLITTLLYQYSIYIYIFYIKYLCCCRGVKKELMVSFQTHQTGQQLEVVTMAMVV